MLFCTTFSVIPTIIHFDKCKEPSTPYLNGYPSTSMYQKCESHISSDSNDGSDFSDGFIEYILCSIHMSVKMTSVAQ